VGGNQKEKLQNQKSAGIEPEKWQATRDPKKEKNVPAARNRNAFPNHEAIRAEDVVSSLKKIKIKDQRNGWRYCEARTLQLKSPLSVAFRGRFRLSTRFHLYDG